MKKKFLLLLTIVSVLGSGLGGFAWADTNEDYHQPYIGGYPDNTIKPKDEISREEAAVVLEKALDLKENPNSSDLSFKDLEETRWSYKYIKSAFDNGLIVGYKDGSFKPKGNLTRAETVTMLARYNKAELDGISVTNPEYKGHWAEKELQYALDNGLINGYNDGKVRPNNTITRAEFITIMNSFLDRQCKPTNIKVVNKFKDVKETDWFYRDIIEATNPHTSFYYDPNSGIPKKHYEVASLKNWINENQDYLVWEGVPGNTRVRFKNYYNNQVEVKIIDGKMSEDKSINSFHFGIGENIGGSLNMSIDSKDASSDKGITITSYVNNGREWNVDGSPKIDHIEKGRYYVKRNIYDLYYDSILDNGLDYYMVPEDTIDVDITIDYNDGDFIKYNVRQDVRNNYFSRDYYGIDKQWDHNSRPINK